MRMGLGVKIGLGHGGITSVLQTQFSGFIIVCKQVRHSIYQNSYFIFPHCYIYICV